MSLAERDPSAASRLVIVVVIVWNLVVLMALLATSVIGVLDVRQACEAGLGELDAGRAEITTTTGTISVSCNIGDQVVEIPIIGYVAVLLFGGFGFVVSVLLTVSLVAFRRKVAAS